MNRRKMRKRRRRKKLLRRLLLFFLLFLIVTAGVVLLKSFSTADIVLDAGHGGKDQGASGGDVIEKEITLEVARKVQAILEDAGYKVKMVRNDDTFVELGERAQYANRKKAKVFVSIHCNSSEDGEGEGIETYYTESKGEDSRKLAEALQQNLIRQTNARDREVRTADYTVIVRTEMPAALVEIGFLSSSTERQLLTQWDYQEKIAEGIAAGIMEYL